MKGTGRNTFCLSDLIKKLFSFQIPEFPEISLTFSLLKITRSAITTVAGP